MPIYIIYSVKGKESNLIYEGQTSGATPKEALRNFGGRYIGGTYYQRKKLVAMPAKYFKPTSWGDIEKAVQTYWRKRRGSR